MKVGVINFHFSNNFGAVLESVALKEYLEKQGCDVLTIDFRPEYLEQQFVGYPNPFAYARWARRDYSDAHAIYRGYRMLRRMLQAIVRYKSARKRNDRMKCFEEFVNSNFSLTERYRTNDELRAAPPKCDMYICGSDQIWNPYVTAGIEPAYFLEFVAGSAKKIAYAVSPCQLDLNKYGIIVKGLLKDYTHISLREKNLINEFENLIGRSVNHCIDPTLLLEQEDYKKYEETPKYISNDYILVYGFIDKKNPDYLYEAAKYVADLLGVEIIDISIDETKMIDGAKRIQICSPGEFLYYIKNSKFVVTNSFHGTVFSLIYEKKFVSFEKNETGIRMKELLSSVGLNEYCIRCDEISKISDIAKKEIDYVGVHNKLKEIRYDSINYLSECLS